MEKIKVFEKYFTSKIHLYDKVCQSAFVSLTSCPGLIVTNNRRFLCIVAQDEIERQGSVLVDYADLTGDKTVRRALPNLTTDLKEQPEVMLKCLGVAIHQVNTQF